MNIKVIFFVFIALLILLAAIVRDPVREFFVGVGEKVSPYFVGAILGPLTPFFFGRAEYLTSAVVFALLGLSFILAAFFAIRKFHFAIALFVTSCTWILFGVFCISLLLI
jgi:hypothetical protein